MRRLTESTVCFLIAYSLGLYHHSYPSTLLPPPKQLYTSDRRREDKMIFYSWTVVAVLLLPLKTRGRDLRSKSLRSSARISGTSRKSSCKSCDDHEESGSNDGSFLDFICSLYEEASVDCTSSEKYLQVLCPTNWYERSKICEYGGGVVSMEAVEAGYCLETLGSDVSDCVLACVSVVSVGKCCPSWECNV